MKQNKLLFTFFLFLILLVPTIAADKIVESGSFTEGYDIKYPLKFYLQQGESKELHFHVFNLSDGTPITSGINCYFHLYNADNSHIYISDAINTTEHIFDYGVSINGTNFSNLGMYNYIFQCNNFENTLGGFVNVRFEVTETGTDPTVFEGVPINPTSSTAIIFFILFVTLGLFILPFIKEFTKLDWANLIIKRGCWAIAIYLMMLNTAILSTIVKSSGLDVLQEIFRYTWLFGILGYVFLGFMTLKTLIDVMELWKIKKIKKRMRENE
jgi:hypothetical protein